MITDSDLELITDCISYLREVDIEALEKYVISVRNNEPERTREADGLAFLITAAKIFIEIR